MGTTQEPTFELIEVGGRLKWLSNLGDLLPYVAGGSDDGDNNPPPDTTRKFTQEEMNTTVGEAKRRAKEAAQADLLKQLGVEDPDAAKKLIQAAKDAEAANATELEKANKRAAEAEAKAQGGDKTLAEINLTIAIEKALIREGQSVEAAERIRKMIEVQKNDPDEIKSAIAALKKDMPSLFAPAGGGHPNSNPGTPPGKEGKPGDPAATARSVLHERHPHLKTT